MATTHNNKTTSVSGPPPVRRLSPWEWARENLFSTPLNGLLTLLGLWLFFLLVPPLFNWALLSADFSGTTRDDCGSGGACWVFIRVYLPQFLFGFYPEDQRWRVVTAFVTLVLLLTPLFIERFRYKRPLTIAFIFGYPLVAWWLFHGGILGLAEVGTHRWGGLFLTLVIAGVGCVAAVPLGILLALGRRSNMPIVKSVCTVFIEFWRGVPLITVLFMASVMLPLFLPEGVNFNKLLRALIGISLWAGAYMAEVVRGGLQGIPQGQYEAGTALGLSYWQRTRLIILPQALKMVIPGIVNTFIAVFKDTTLVLIIGLFDLLGMVQAAATDPQWLGYAIEGYVFAGLVFWVFCYGMSRYSRHVEYRLQYGHASQERRI